MLSFRIYFRAVSYAVFALAFIALPGRSLQASDHSLRPGLYAPVSENGARVFLNRNTFTCNGRGADYCRLLEKYHAFTVEEQEMMKGGEVTGQIRLSRDPESGNLYVSGGFYALRACDVSTSVRPGEDSGTEYFNEPKPAQCVVLQPGEAVCPFVDTYDATASDPLLLTLRGGPGDTIVISARAPEGAGLKYPAGCMKALEQTVLRYETQAEYDRNEMISARLDYLRANAELVHLWRGLFDDETRAQLQEKQRAWIRQKDLQCGRTDMKGTDPELARMYRCQKRLIMKRLGSIVQDLR